MQGGGGQVLMLLVDFGQDNGGHAHLGLQGSLLGGSLVGDLGQAGGQLGGSDESHDVGVVLEHEDLLVGGLVESGRSDSDNGALSHVRELELEGKSVEGLSGVVSELELVGVLVELEHLQHLGADIEVGPLLGSFLEVADVVTSDVGGGEEGGGPLLEGVLDGNILSLEGGSLSGEGVRCVGGDGLSKRGGLISGVKGPRALVEHVDVELSLVLVDSHVGSVDSDGVSDSVHDRQVLELVGVDHDGCVGALGVEGGVNDLEGADESVSVGLVGESGIDNDTVEVAGLTGGEGSLGELDVLVLKAE